ncbi:MAG: prepilin-type N-terminal cleavage/methylation domain-containing protein [Gemmatimonadota bacterium]
MRPDRGIALLEVLVALTILGTAGLSLVGMLREASAAETATAREEHEVQTAGRVLGALTLLNRTELEQRIGVHPVGEYSVDIARPEATLFRLGVSRRDRPHRTLLATVVFRPLERRP